jgi:hypothetical protein
MKLTIVGVVVACASAVAGCGAAEVTVHSQAAHQVAQEVALQAPRHCAIDFRTLATASEAFWAMNGTYPKDQSELVTAGLLRGESDDFELTVVGSDYALVGVQDCAAFEPDETSFDPEPDESSDDSSQASTCNSDRRSLETAYEAYYADRGVPPETEAELVDAGLLAHESEGWDLVGGQIVAVAGVCT